MIDGLGGTPNVVLMNGGPTDNNSKLFKQGYYESGDYAVKTKADAGDVKVVADQDVPDWDNQEALTLFEQILVAQKNKVDAVYAANDGIAGAVVSALQSAKHDPIPVVGSGRDLGRDPEHPRGLADDDGLQADQGRGRRGGGDRDRLLNGMDPKRVEGEWEV